MEITDGKKFIMNFIGEETIKLLADCSGFGYLNCRWNMWKDASNVTHSMEDMRSSYLKNCIKTIDKGMVFCQTSYLSQLKTYMVENLKQVDIYNEYTNLEEISIDAKQEIGEYIRDEVYKLLEEKKQYIQQELKDR